jgi:hypothetical protein
MLMRIIQSYFARVQGLPMPGTIENYCFEPLEVPESPENTKAVLARNDAM